MPILKYPLAYCIELDTILPPDNARDAHSSFLNPSPMNNFHFFCPDENCGCKLSGNRIHRWEKSSGTAYYSRYNKNELHSSDCEFAYLNPTSNITTTSGGEMTVHHRETLYPSWFNTELDNDIYQFDFNTHNLTHRELLLKIAHANVNMIDWENIPISDLRVIIEAYKSMNDDEKNTNFLRIDENENLRYTNCFTQINWLPRADGLYPHIYVGKIKNKNIKKEDDFFTFFLDWNLHTFNNKSFIVKIQEGLVENNFMNKLFLENLRKDTKWEEAYFYAIDPNIRLSDDESKYIVTVNHPNHFVVSVISPTE